MSILFVDTSALAKRYLVEPGSKWVKSWIAPRMGNTIFISELTKVEIISFLARRQREQVILPVELSRQKASLL